MISNNATLKLATDYEKFGPLSGAGTLDLVLNAVGEYIGAQFEQETKKFSERVKKYTGKKRGRKG